MGNRHFSKIKKRYPRALGCERLENRQMLTTHFEELAFRWAPIHHQDVDVTGGNSLSGRSDYITNVDFDGDWDTRNNWEHTKTHDLVAHAYYSVTETRTHWHIVYAFFHPRDWADHLVSFADTHENDMEGILAIVRKPVDDKADEYGTLEAMFTVFHHGFYSYVTDVSSFSNGVDDGQRGSREDIDGRLSFDIHPEDSRWHPVTAQEAKGHGIKAWPQVRIKGGDGVIYYPSLDRAEEPEHPNDRLVRYKLVNIFEKNGLWDQRLSSETFHRYGKFHATVVCISNDCPRASTPWSWNDRNDGPRLLGGELATDPARVASLYFSNLGDFAREYIHNEYRGIHYKSDTDAETYVHLMPQSVQPPLVKGDAEFDGHGPRIQVESKIRLNDDGNLETRIRMFAEECAPDNRTFNGCQPKRDYTTADGWSKWRETPIELDGFRIVEILSPTEQEDFFVDNDHSVNDITFDNGDRLIQSYEFVGDTKDRNDAGSRTYVTAYFNRVRVRVRPIQEHTDSLPIGPQFVPDEQVSAFGRPGIFPRNSGGRDEANGIAFDGEFWFLAYANPKPKIVKFDRDFRPLKYFYFTATNLGCSHVGGIDAHDGDIWIALDNCTGGTSKVAVLDSNFENLRSALLESVGNNFPWVSINPLDDKVFYTVDKSVGSTRMLGFSTSFRDGSRIKPIKTVEFLSPHPQQVTGRFRTQGGDFSPNGLFFRVIDDAERGQSPHTGIWIYKIDKNSDGRQIAKRVGQINQRYHPGFWHYEELEDIDISAYEWNDNLTDVHLLMLDNDASTDEWSLIHYQSGDSDHDTISDVIDNCVWHANPDQLDIDADGVGTACDLAGTFEPNETAQNSASLEFGVEHLTSIESSINPDVDYFLIDVNDYSIAEIRIRHSASAILDIAIQTKGGVIPQHQKTVKYGRQLDGTLTKETYIKAALNPDRRYHLSTKSADSRNTFNYTIRVDVQPAEITPDEYELSQADFDGRDTIQAVLPEKPERELLGPNWIGRRRHSHRPIPIHFPFPFPATTIKLMENGRAESGGKFAKETLSDLSFHSISDRDFYEFQIDPNFEYSDKACNMPILGTNPSTGRSDSTLNISLTPSDQVEVGDWSFEGRKLPFNVVVYNKDGKLMDPKYFDYEWSSHSGIGRLAIECPTEKTIE